MQTLSVILAGGSGTRFWPLSRVTLPKQVLNISGNDAMINETIRRCDGIIPHKNTFVVTARCQEKKIRDVLIETVPRENIIIEPAARSTAPCILFAAMKLEKIFGDGVMCIFPSDQYITDNAEFSAAIGRAVELASSSDKLVTLGIKPTFASTGYGYINFDSKNEQEGAFAVSEFVEKPSYDKAVRYIKDGRYLWNSGIFIWKVSAIIQNFKRYLPRIYARLQPWYEAIGTPDENAVLEKCYPSVQKISIDYGIMERSDEVFVIPADMGWNDVGSWDALGAIFPPNEQGNIIRADKNVLIDSTDCIVYSEKQLVSAIGLNNMIVVSAGDALMVCPKKRAQEVKKIVSELVERDMTGFI